MPYQIVSIEIVPLRHNTVIKDNPIILHRPRFRILISAIDLADYDSRPIIVISDKRKAESTALKISKQLNCHTICNPESNTILVDRNKPYEGFSMPREQSHKTGSTKNIMADILNRDSKFNTFEEVLKSRKNRDIK